VRHYLVPFTTLAALGYQAMGALWTIHHMASASDPQAAALAFGKNFDPSLLGQKDPTQEQIVAIMQYLVAMENCWRCISYYSVTMCDVVPLALQGDEQALVLAASIDPAIFWSPVWGPAIAAMSAEQNRDFFRGLGELAFRVPKKREQSRMLRVAEFVLEDAGAFEVASDGEIFELVAYRLGMRSDLGENPTRALSQVFRRCRRDRTNFLKSSTQIREDA
jgi:hypothetical protein